MCSVNSKGRTRGKVLGDVIFKFCKGFGIFSTKKVFFSTSNQNKLSVKLNSYVFSNIAPLIKELLRRTKNVFEFLYAA